jgi:hypothetical protein
MSHSNSCGCDPGCLCGACRGIRDETPLKVDNRAGLSALHYRVGDHARFKASLLAGISRAALPALRELTTRRDDDFSIGLLDAFAVMADVLTFYQERIANESYLRTATERLSIGHLARLIGYELRPGSAANVPLAFTMQEVAPVVGPRPAASAVERLRLRAGTRAQSTPGPDEKAQAFETVEEVEVRPAWNRIPARAVQEQELDLGTSVVRLKGAGLNVRAGDAFLLTFRTPGGTDFTACFRRVASVQADARGQWTEVKLGPALAAATFDGMTPAQTGAFAFRKHASRFGYNAPDYKTLDESRKVPQGGSDWPLALYGITPNHLNLDAVYREAVPGSWGIWEREGALGSPLIFRVAAAGERGRSDYALSGKATTLVIERGKGVSTSILAGNFWELRMTSVAVQSEKLELAEAPVPLPVMGMTVALAGTVGGLEPGRTAALQGKQVRAEVLKPVTLFLWTGSSWTPRALVAGARLDLLFFPIPFQDGALTWFVVVEEGQLGLVLALPGQVRYRNDEDGTELVTIAAVAEDGSSLTLDAPLARRYDPATVTLNANVAAATHGESVSEVFEGGDATRTFQRFALKQTPLTYVASAASPSGVRSTLRVWADEVEWHEVPWLYGRGPRERVFITRQDGEGKTWIQFGDGLTGSRLPTGQRNVRAEYRRGIGSAGIVKAGQIDLLLTRPAGLKEVTNPLPAADGKDPEVLADARRNAPLTVLTLDRVVSLRDFEDFARAFAGIYKARATWSWFHHTRGVFLTVAGFEGGAVSVAGRRKLKDALAAWGDPFVPVAVESHAAATFRAGLRVKVDRDREAALVLRAVNEALRRAFSFEERDLGQPVTLAELTATAQRVPGVVAVQVAALYRSGTAPAALLPERLPCRAPLPGERGTVLAAEILTLAPGPLDLLEELA